MYIYIYVHTNTHMCMPQICLCLLAIASSAVRYQHSQHLTRRWASNSSTPTHRAVKP